MSNKANGHNLPRSQMRSAAGVQYSGPHENESQYQVYTYESPWRTYALAYSWRYDYPLRFCIGSFIDEPINKVRDNKL